jgi:hypothetical protein
VHSGESLLKRSAVCEFPQSGDKAAVRISARWMGTRLLRLFAGCSSRRRVPNPKFFTPPLTKPFGWLHANTTQLDAPQNLVQRAKVRIVFANISTTPAEIPELLHRLVDRSDTGELLADLMSKWGPRQSRIVAPGLIKWGTRDGGEITRWDARLRLIEDCSVMAGFDKISATGPRLMYRMAHAIPAWRNHGAALPIRVLDSGTSAAHAGRG